MITFAGITPLIIIFITYTSNPKFYLISIIFDNTQNIPSIISAYNPVMTKVMDIYGKSAPLLALIAFTLQLRDRKLETIANREKLITASIFSPFFSFMQIFFFGKNFKINPGGGGVGGGFILIFTLFIFYACLYFCSFFMTYALCYIPVVSYKLWKERSNRS